MSIIPSESNIKAVLREYMFTNKAKKIVDNKNVINPKNWINSLFLMIQIVINIFD
ncbi:hypothetical protein SF1_21360 [Sphingobacterium faecium NBRC 15299]|nr:hypothetical protein SF1_21360 [Sphingobacterium faecium NBRC 15299]